MVDGLPEFVDHLPECGNCGERADLKIHAKASGDISMTADCPKCPWSGKVMDL